MGQEGRKEGPESKKREKGRRGGSTASQQGGKAGKSISIGIAKRSRGEEDDISSEVGRVPMTGDPYDYDFVPGLDDFGSGSVRNEQGLRL